MLQTTLHLNPQSQRAQLVKITKQEWPWVVKFDKNLFARIQPDRWIGSAAVYVKKTRKHNFGLEEL